MRPQPKPVDFTLKPGQLVRGQVVGAAGQPMGGVCVVLNQWHCHTDQQGYFNWSAEDPVPQEVMLHVYKKYHKQYETLETTVTLLHLPSHSITLKDK